MTHVCVDSFLIFPNKVSKNTRQKSLMVFFCKPDAFITLLPKAGYPPFMLPNDVTGLERPKMYFVEEYTVS